MFSKKIYAAISELTGSFYLFIDFWWNEFFWRNKGVIFKYLLYWCRKLFEGCFLVVGAGVMKGYLDNLMKDKTYNCNLILSTGHSHETQRRDSIWEGNLKMKVLARSFHIANMRKIIYQWLSFFAVYISPIELQCGRLTAVSKKTVFQ